MSETRQNGPAAGATWRAADGTPGDAADAAPEPPRRFMQGRLLEILSLPLLLLLWQCAAWIAQSRFMPGPVAVAAEIWQELLGGRLIDDFAQTLTRAFAGFVIAMVLGTAIGIALGRIRPIDRLLSPWVVVGLNIPAIVVGIICYIWLGLTDVALVIAVVINKVPLVTTMMREGVRSLSEDFDELARMFRMPRARYLRLVLTPQLVPYLLAAARTGLSLVWKMVLVFEVLGSDGGVGFRVGVYFQFFDMTGILAYATVFVLVIMVIEYGLLRPLERRVLRWRADRN
ncbi:ABC transporter permease [Pseudoroseicyclus sp. H15]